MKEKTCCFTGHRNIPPSEIPVVMAKTEMLVRSLIQEGVKYYGVGGAIGFDTLAAQLLLRLRDAEQLDIRVILVCPFDGFTSRWTPAQKSTFAALLPRFDKVVYKEKTGSREAYLSRDRHLVDSAAYCIAYCTRSSGGTAYTVRYAMKQGVTVLNTADFDISSL